MVPSSSQNPQVTQQFLNSVLSQRGPSALPYSEDTKWLIRQHLVALINAYPSLVPKTASFTHNDGRTINLLQAEGTVPMPFQGVTYNIPVIIWLMESYPRHPPCVYVNPTRDMIIKRPHSVVNPCGLVSAPYLQNWVYPSSNLEDLVRHLSSVFGRDPPLYSQRRPTASPSPPPPNPAPTPSSGPSFGLSSHPSQNYGSHSNRIPPSPYGSGSVSQRVQTDDPSEVFKRNAVDKLVGMAHSNIASLRKGRETEMEGLFNAQAVLRQREEHLNRGLKEMQEEKEGLEQKLQMVLMNEEILENWLRENEEKSIAANSLNVDDAFECTDPLSKQMLDCTASDLAIEDVVYSMDKALQDGAIPFDQYLRNVRLLSREQFFHRATGIKIRAVQMQAQVSSMAARITQYVS